jgi:hypothetical protein
MRSDPCANGAEDDSALALDQLVAEELSALRVTATEPIEHQLTDFAERLRAHPDREALVERLRVLVLGPPEPEAPPAPDGSPSSDAA